MGKSSGCLLPFRLLPAGNVGYHFSEEGGGLEAGGCLMCQDGDWDINIMNMMRMGENDGDF